MSDSRADFQRRLAALPEREIAEPEIFSDPRLRNRTMRAALYPLTYPLAFLLGLVLKILIPIVFLLMVNGQVGPLLPVTPTTSGLGPAMYASMFLAATMGVSVVVLGIFNAVTRAHIFLVFSGIATVHTLDAMLAAGA